MECVLDCGGLGFLSIFNIFLYILFAALAVYVGYKLIKRMLTHTPKLTWVKRAKAAAKAGVDGVAGGKAGADAGCSGNTVMLVTLFIMAAIIVSGVSAAVGYIIGIN